MSSLWTDLLYLHGYITDHKLARRLVNDTGMPTKGHANKPRQSIVPKAKSARWYARLCLGIGDGIVHTQ